MRQRFEKGDKNLYSLSVTAAMIATILIIASVFFGITIIAKLSDINSAASLNTLITGLVFLIVIPLIIWLGYRIVMYFIWLSFDIKIIRNKLLGIEDTDAMLDLCPLHREAEEKNDDMLNE